MIRQRDAGALAHQITSDHLSGQPVHHATHCPLSHDYSLLTQRIGGVIPKTRHAENDETPKSVCLHSVYNELLTVDVYHVSMKHVIRRIPSE